jgi:hypothetical protein
VSEFVNQLYETLVSQKKQLGIILLLVGVMIFLGVLLTKLDIIMIVGLAILVGAGLVLLSRPDTATMVVLFVLYTNISVVAIKIHKVPPAVAGAVILLIFLPFVVHVFIRRQKIKIDYILLLMGIYFATLLLSFFPAIDKEIAFGWIVEFLLEGALLYFLIINVIRNSAILRKVIWTLILGGSLLGSLTVYQDITRSYKNDFWGLAQRNLLRGYDEKMPGGDRGLIRTREKVRLADRAMGSMGDPNRFAQVLIVLLPLAFFRFFDEKKKSLKLLAVICAVLILSGILLTYSRGAFVSICLMVLLMGVLRYIRLYQILLSAVLILLIIAIASPGYFNRMQSLVGVQGLFSRAKTAEADAVILGRTTEMLAAFMVFLDHPIVGVGPGQYIKFYALEYQDNPDIAFRRIDKGRRAHSLFLELAAENGILGLGSFMAVVFFVLYQLWKSRRHWRERNQEYANYAIAFFLSIVGYLSTAMFLSLAFQRFYWILIALAGSTIQILNLEKPEEVSSTNSSLKSAIEKEERFII